MKKHISISFLSLMLVSACGKDSDEGKTATSISSDSEMSEASMSANFQDAMNAMSDSNAQSGSTSLALASPILEVDRNCVAEDGKAKVDISSEFSLDKTVGGPNNSVSFKVDSSFELQRVWSKEGTEIDCGIGGKFAAIDLTADLSGLQADITFKRSASSSHTVTNSKNGTTKTNAVASASEGSRTIRWESQSESASALTRNITVSSDSTHSLTVTKQNGQQESLVLTMATEASAPLVIETEEESSAIASRMIKSGKIVASTQGKGRVESVFESLKISFDDDGCAPESGKVTMSVFAEGSATAALIYEIKAEDGVYVVSNISDAANPVEVEDFAIQVCDVRNFDY